MKIATADQMHELGVRIGKLCQAGDLILLNGPLGAGKTVLVQGIGEALGISDVTSPTFVIARIHKGPLPLIHVEPHLQLNVQTHLGSSTMDSAASL